MLGLQDQIAELGFVLTTGSQMLPYGCQMKKNILALCNKAGTPVMLAYSKHKLLAVYAQTFDMLILNDSDFERAEIRMERKRWSIRRATMTIVTGDKV